MQPMSCLPISIPVSYTHLDVYKRQYLSSVDADAMSRSGFGLGCAHLELEQSDAGSSTDEEGRTDYYTRIQQNNPLDEKLLEARCV